MPERYGNIKKNANFQKNPQLANAVCIISRLWMVIATVWMLKGRIDRARPDNRKHIEAISKTSFGLRLWRIGASFKILEILEYACGFKLGTAANLNQNSIFEMASEKNPGRQTAPSGGLWLRS